MSEDLIEATKKGLKKVAEFLETEEVGKPHHSERYLPPPKGSEEVSLVGTNVPTSWQEQVDRRANIKKATELEFVARIGSGGRTKRYG